MRLSIITLFFYLILLSVDLPAAEITKVCFKNICLEVEIADSDQSRALGLMFREKLKANQGMLFIFDRDWQYPFWMKNMTFALDLIWISKDKTVVDITANAQPCQDTCDSLTPAKAVQYVLEVNAGFAQKNNIQIADRINF